MTGRKARPGGRASWTSFLAWLRNPDPRVAVGNRLAAVLGGNGPFYPLYVVLVAGWTGPQVLLTMLACPFFLAVPFVARRHPLLARLALMAVSLGNTVFCTWVLGEPAGVELFLIPCVILAAMLFRARERLFLLPLLVLPLILFYALHGHYGSLSHYDATASLDLFAMNAFSVGCLVILMGWMIASERAEHEPRTPA